MDKSDANVHCEARFAELFCRAAMHTASAPGRLEVLGNHTDYNLGLTLSCAIDLRCYVSIAMLESPEVHLSSSAFNTAPEVYLLDHLSAASGHWANYVLGLLAVLQQRGAVLPGLAIHVDSKVPGSAGLSSSSALEMSALTVIARMIGADLSPNEMARIGQRVESEVVGAQTGLLDQLTSLLGKRRHLLGIDFKTHKTRHLKMPAGWCFVAVDSGVKHDLTLEYNQRRASCEKAAELMRIASLRDADRNRLTQRRDEMPDDAWRCARHVIGENERVQQAHAALMKDDVETLGELMFESHASSRDDLRNSCEQLDALVEHARQDTRCIGARLSGGGFGGISIHLVREEDAKTYLGDLLRVFRTQATPDRWAQVCLIDDGARVE